MTGERVDLIERPESVCVACPAWNECDAADAIVDRMKAAGLMDERGVKYSRVLTARRRIVIEESSKIHPHDKPSKDKDELDECPLPIGRIGSLVSGGESDYLASAGKIADQTEDFGFRTIGEDKDG